MVLNIYYSEEVVAMSRKIFFIRNFVSLFYVLGFSFMFQTTSALAQDLTKTEPQTFEDAQSPKSGEETFTLEKNEPESGGQPDVSVFPPANPVELKDKENAVSLITKSDSQRWLNVYLNLKVKCLEIDVKEMSFLAGAIGQIIATDCSRKKIANILPQELETFCEKDVCEKDCWNIILNFCFPANQVRIIPKFVEYLQNNLSSNKTSNSDANGLFALNSNDSSTRFKEILQNSNINMEVLYNNVKNDLNRQLKMVEATLKRLEVKKANSEQTNQFGSIIDYIVKSFNELFENLNEPLLIGLGFDELTNLKFSLQNAINSLNALTPQDQQAFKNEIAAILGKIDDFKLETIGTAANFVSKSIQTNR